MWCRCVYCTVVVRSTDQARFPIHGLSSQCVDQGQLHALSNAICGLSRSTVCTYLSRQWCPRGLDPATALTGNVFSETIEFSSFTLCAYAQRFMCLVMYVCVCVTKKHLFTHLSVKCLYEKYAYCSLIHFICHQRCLLDLLSHTESTILLISIVPLQVYVGSFKTKPHLVLRL